MFIFILILLYQINDKKENYMKKLFTAISIILIFTGCGDNINTPFNPYDMHKVTHDVTFNIIDIHSLGGVTGEIINTTDYVIGGSSPLTVTAHWHNYLTDTTYHYCGDDTEKVGIGIELGIGDTLEFEMFYQGCDSISPVLGNIYLWTYEPNQ